MALTDKQASFDRLHALRQVAMRIGMLSPCKALRPTSDEIKHRIDVHGMESLIAALLVIADESATAVQKTAALCIVEYFWPDFMEVADGEFIGSVLERGDARVLDWRRRVLKRDGFKCKKCGDANELHAHHIARWAHAPHLRIVVENGVTLCRKCHEKEHSSEGAFAAGPATG